MENKSCLNFDRKIRQIEQCAAVGQLVLSFVMLRAVLAAAGDCRKSHCSGPLFNNHCSYLSLTLANNKQTQSV